LSIVELDAVTKRFGKVAVIDDLSLVVEPGTILGLIGPSGSGKTTAVRLMTGAYRPDEGRALLFGRDAAELSRYGRSRIGYLPQLPVLSPDLPLGTNLRFVAALNGAGRKVRQRRMPEVLDLVRLTDATGTKARDASGGMQRRAALAGALLHDPELLFLDEPTAGIDPILRAELWERFHQLRTDGRTLIVTTQYVAEAAHCDEVALIADGRLVAVGPPERLRDDAAGADLVEVTAERALPPAAVAAVVDLPEVLDVEVLEPTRLRAMTNDALAAQPAISAALERLEVTAVEVERVELSYDEMFVRLVERASAEQSVAEAHTTEAPPEPVGR
jgi:ABC-2 type transport system ATP-binding protein